MEDKFIEKLEHEFQITLPQDYKHFLKGGIVKVGDKNFLIGETCHDVCYENNNSNNNGTMDFVAFHLFYGNDEENVSDLHHENSIVFYKRIPDDFIVIGCDLVGDQICLGVKGEYTGKVYMWEMEFEADEDTPQPYYENMTLITNTFQEFLDGLFLDI